MEYGIIQEIYGANNTQNTYNNITIGVVIDTNDPQQQGRVRVRCSSLGETPDTIVENIPWALYMTPFGGTTTRAIRGPDETNSEGDVAYGMWNIPKNGSLVMVACIDGDPNYRVWMGCIYDRYTPNTMPHGRFLSSTDGTPSGPFSSAGSFIQPLASNQQTAFGEATSDNKEFRTRGADFQVSAIRQKNDYTITDDLEGDIRQGYDTTQTSLNYKNEITGDTLDSHTHSWVTPGFHAISMDDKVKNCRMRFRTSTGHQIILDDTNERIYVMTAEGNNWIEMDQNGNIDIYSKRRVSVHSEKDINLYSDETVRIQGKKGIHLSTENEIRMSSKGSDLNLSDGLTLKTSKESFLDIGGDLNIKGDTIKITGMSGTHIKGEDVNIEGTNLLNLTGSSQVLVTGGAIQLNGPSASIAEAAASAHPTKSFKVSRVPTHEPFPRTTTKDDDTIEPQFSSTDSNVGKVERTDTIDRNKHWRR